MAPFYVKAVDLIWKIQKLSNNRHVESVISAKLNSKEMVTRLETFEAFGNLWRYTGKPAKLPFTM